MLCTVMDDGVEPAVTDIQLPRVLAALADPHRLAAVQFVARHGESWCAQVTLQGRGCDVHRPDIEAGHEHRGQHDGKHQPSARIRSGLSWLEPC